MYICMLAYTYVCIAKMDFMEECLIIDKIAKGKLQLILKSIQFIVLYYFSNINYSNYIHCSLCLSCVLLERNNYKLGWLAVTHFDL